jgi:protein SCO1/2
MRAPRLPALVAVLWLIGTLGWWAFAFMPLPADPPAWLTAARYACFGAVEPGLPDASGVILLAVAPATFLAAIFVLWGADLAASVRDLVRSRAGQGLVLLLALVLAVEGAWVAAKLRTGWRVASSDAAAPEPATALPRDYPRLSGPAPDFTLVDQRGVRISLAGLRGRPVVLTFVFAHCQALCPVVIQTLKHAVPGARSSPVLLVTLDPWRDTVSALPAIARQWKVEPHFHVLSSPSVDDVLRVVRAYDVPFERSTTSGDIAHPGLVFLIDAQGRLAYTFNNPPAAWVRDGLDRLG